MIPTASTPLPTNWHGVYGVIDQAVEHGWELSFEETDLVDTYATGGHLWPADIDRVIDLAAAATAYLERAGVPVTA